MEKLEIPKEICVDTDVLIDYLKGKDPGSRTYKEWRRKASVGITAITAFELLLGSKRPGMKEQRQVEIKSLIAQQSFTLPFDISSAEKASEIESQLSRIGMRIDMRDLFIASICSGRDTPLLTRNKEHFSRVQGLRLLDF